jgi:hypothetical protein
LTWSAIGPRMLVPESFGAPNMAIDPFFKPPSTRDEWRARARTIQSQLEGLTIAELMRGADKHGDPTDVMDGDTIPINRASQPEIPTVDSGEAKAAAAERLVFHGSSRMRRPTTTGYPVRTTRAMDITMRRDKRGNAYHCVQKREQSLRRRCRGRYPIGFGAGESSAGYDMLTTKRIENIMPP